MNRTTGSARPPSGNSTPKKEMKQGNSRGEYSTRHNGGDGDDFERSVPFQSPESQRQQEKVRDLENNWIQIKQAAESVAPDSETKSATRSQGAD